MVGSCIDLEQTGPRRPDGLKDEKLLLSTPQEWYNNFKEVNPSGEVSKNTYRMLYSEKLFGEIG